MVACDNKISILETSSSRCYSFSICRRIRYGFDNIFTAGSITPIVIRKTFRLRPDTSTTVDTFICSASFYLCGPVFDHEVYRENTAAVCVVTRVRGSCTVSQQQLLRTRRTRPERKIPVLRCSLQIHRRVSPRYASTGNRIRNVFVSCRHGMIFIISRRRVTRSRPAGKSIRDTGRSK